MPCKSRVLLLLLIACLLPLLAALPACAPSISREMLTPSPTITRTPQPTRTPDPNRTATPTLAPQDVLMPAITSLDNLLLEQYPLLPVNGYDLQPASVQQNQAFYEQIPAGVFSQRQDLWAPQPISSLAEINAALQVFNYRLEKVSADSATYRLYQGSELLREDITYFGDIQLSRSGNDFLLPLTLQNMEVWILQKARFELWFSGAPRFLPVFAGDDLVAIGPVSEIQQGGKSVLGVSILKNDQPIYQVALPHQGANKCPIQNFRSWNSQWVLEMDGTVVKDGVSLAEQYGYTQVFDWQTMNAKEFFLFEKDSSYGIWYDGRELPIRFDSIVRWSCADQQGGQGYNFSARGNSQIAGFFAQKDGVWYYVEVTPTT